MSAFLTKLQLEAASNEDDGKWIVTRDLIYQSTVADLTIIVPAGFVTDLASVPRLPIIYMLTGDTSSAAAVIHDFCYSSGIVSRKMADAILKEASAVTGVPAWRRWLMWAGVRIGGSSHYKQDDSKAA